MFAIAENQLIHCGWNNYDLSWFKVTYLYERKLCRKFQGKSSNSLLDETYHLDELGVQLRSDLR